MLYFCSSLYCLSPGKGLETRWLYYSQCSGLYKRLCNALECQGSDREVALLPRVQYLALHPQAVYS